MLNNNFLTWLSLIILTSGSYFFAEQSGGSMLIGTVLLFSLLKVALVVLQFMEMKKSHSGWLWILGLILMIFVGGVFFLFRNAG